jgi:hypothetical protein
VKFSCGNSMLEVDVSRTSAAVALKRISMT